MTTTNYLLVFGVMVALWALAFCMIEMVAARVNVLSGELEALRKETALLRREAARREGRG